MNETVLLSTAYLPPVSYFSKFWLYKKVIIEQHEHFVKQSYRNRCSIYGANGKLDLIVPLVHDKERTPVVQKRISYAQPWQNLHWKSLQSAYRSSPYFEYFEDEFKKFYSGKPELLSAFNLELIRLVLKLLKKDPEIMLTTAYEKSPEGVDDLRNAIYPRHSFTADKNFVVQKYYQVFEAKCGFIADLSIVDLLFNEGLRANEILAASVAHP